jgi:transglutaminase-like putative cysteine protease
MWCDALKEKGGTGVSTSKYLLPGKFIESDDPLILEFSKARIGDAQSDVEKALRLFYAVRDEVLYDPYLPMGDPASYSGKAALERGRGWCVPKSALLTACARAAGIKARPGYADVVNHLATDKLKENMGTDVFAWHSYTELWLGGKWVKATPAFNKSLCDKFGLKPLDFDGETDSLFHEFDQAGNQHMEYILDRGTYQDVPYDEIIATFAEIYQPDNKPIEGDFQQEAGQD